VIECSAEDVAYRASVDPDYVGRLVEVGILRPKKDETFVLSDVPRVRSVQTLERDGVPLDRDVFLGAAGLPGPSLAVSPSR
jgi:hypothetical protein